MRNVFLFEGSIISFGGALMGGALGLIICVLQQNYGFVSMGMASAVQEAYPVKIIASDFLFTMLTILVITFLASIQPAIKAQKLHELSKL
ncbi:MAG: lipoprotein-releasing system permease protein [Marivirga sp.]